MVGFVPHILVAPEAVAAETVCQTQRRIATGLELSVLPFPLPTTFQKLRTVQFLVRLSQIAALVSVATL